MMSELDELNADFASRHPEAFASVLRHGELAEIVDLIGRLPPIDAAAIVAHLPTSLVTAILAADPPAAERWLARARQADAVSLLGRIPRERALVLINSLSDRERRRRLRQFLNYPAHSIGALVSDVPMRLPSDTPAEELLVELRSSPAEQPVRIIVLHPDGTYLGVVDPWLLMVADSLSVPVREFAVPLPTLHPGTSIVNAAQERHWQAHSWLPVVDHERRVLGGIARERVLQACGTQMATARLESDTVMDLLAQMLRVLGQLLDRLLLPRAQV
jgi:Mg/Co/Ni transporter MgtE